MLKILFALNEIVTMTALIFWGFGIKYFKNEKYNIKGFKYIMAGTSITAVCIVLSAVLFSPVFF